MRRQGRVDREVCQRLLERRIGTATGAVHHRDTHNAVWIEPRRLAIPCDAAWSDIEGKLPTHERQTRRIQDRQDSIRV
jgi:hypothetical protein